LWDILAKMKVIVKKVSGRLHEFNVEPTDKVFTMKQKLSEEIGIHVDQIALVYSGKPLKENETFDEQSIKPNSEIQMIPTLIGG
jgi:ubiquitin-like protein Nedd8